MVEGLWAIQASISSTCYIIVQNLALNSLIQNTQKIVKIQLQLPYC